uniref:Uncharacterized protein n=1 Tax=Lactuca sativa TaxID=4236 RepID=A0A9R1VUN5_LACSA|nr:hypothetical protein LSAT_V11C400220680 [Lactuca sativa]
MTSPNLRVLQKLMPSKMSCFSSTKISFMKNGRHSLNLSLELRSTIYNEGDKNSDLLKDDIFDYVKHFKHWRGISQGRNSSFMTMVPKFQDPLTLTYFHPISLIGCLHKIIAKLLATQLIGMRFKHPLLRGVTSLMVQCLSMKYALRPKKEKNEDFAFQLGISGFRDMVLSGESWINECLTFAKAPILFNGSPTYEFVMEKGVRQIDLLSPFHIIIVMEGLNVVMKSACEEGIFQGIKIPHNNVLVSYFFYEDDSLFMGGGGTLKVNFNKSKVIGVGSAMQETTIWALHLGYGPSSLLFNYLGVPMGDNLNLKRN